MTPPTSAFYSTVAQLVPLLLIALAIDERGLTGAKKTERRLLDFWAIVFSVIAEIMAIAGLTGGGGRSTAGIAGAGLGLLGTVFATALLWRFADEIRTTKRRALRWLMTVVGGVTIITPALVGATYSLLLRWG